MLSPLLLLKMVLSLLPPLVFFSLDKSERDGSLIAFDAASGDIVWQETIVAPLFSTPVFVQDSIVVAYDDGNVMTLVVFDTQDGELLRPPFQPSTE